jgi:hypothetical protein
LKLRRYSLLVLWSAAPLALSVSLAAMDASAYGDRKRKVVELVVLGDEDAALAPTLRELVGRVHLTVRTISATDEAFDREVAADALARVSVDARGKGAVGLVIVDGRTGRVALQRSLPRQTSSGVAVEELALVVRWALDALAEGKPVPTAGPGTTDRPAPSASAQPAASSSSDKRTAPPASEQPPATPVTDQRPAQMPNEQRPVPTASDQPASSSSGDKSTTPAAAAGERRAASPLPWSLDLAMLGSARSFATSTGALVGGGGSAVLELGSTAARAALWLSALYYIPVRAIRDSVELDATLLSLRLVPSLAVLDSRAFVFDAGLGGGVDVIHVSPTALGPSVQVTSDMAHFDPVACVMVTGSFRVSPSTAIEVSLQGDVDLAPRRYVVAVGDAHDPALDVLPLRIAGTAGFAFQLAGMDRAP